MIMQKFCGRAVPDPRRKQIEHKTGPPVWPPARLDLARVAVAGLAELPTYGVALAAVPDVGARPLPTSPSLPGTCATGCGSAAPARVTNEQRQFESNLSHESRMIAKIVT